MRSLSFLTAAALVSLAHAQPGLSPPANGPKHADPKLVHILVGGAVHPTPDSAAIFAPGFVTIAGDRIERVGAMTDEIRAAIAAPNSPYVVWDVTGMHLYAGFIDPAVEVEVARPGAAGGTNAADRYWNVNVLPERSALDGAGVDRATGDALRKMGFGAAGIFPVDPGKRRAGVIRGMGAVVSLLPGPTNAEPTLAPPTVYVAQWAVSAAFETAGGFGGGREDAEDAGWFGGFPTSRMGAISLIRQALYDLDGWKAGRPGADRAAPAWVTTLTAAKPMVFDVDNEVDALRAVAIAKEFSRPGIVVGSGTEYRRLAAIAGAMGSKDAEVSPLIIPLSDPRTPDVSTVGRAEETDLRTLMGWEQAPTNPRRLEEAGVRAALTTAKLRDRGEFLTLLRKAIDHGLSKDAALAMLTTRPAAMLGVADRLGTIAPGKVANLTIADGDLFATKSGEPKGADTKADAKAESKDGEGKEGDKPEGKADAKNIGNARVMSVWIEGRRYEFATPAMDMSGMWRVELPGAPAAERFIQFEGELGGGKAPKATIFRNGKRAACTAKVEGETLTLVFDHEPLDGQKGLYTLSGAVLKENGKASAYLGKGLRPGGGTFDFRVTRLGPSRAVGVWRVTEFEGKAKDEADPDQLTIDVAARSVKLKFTKAEGDPIEITADDAVAAEGSLSFKHSLKKLGMEGESTDTATIEGDVLSGVGVLPDGSSHPYKAIRVKAPAPKAVTPKVDPAMVGRWAIVELDGHPHAVGAMYIRSSGELTLNNEHGIVHAKEVKFSEKGFSSVFMLKVDGGELRFEPEATIDGDTLTGTVVVGERSLPWKAKRTSGDPDALAEIPEVVPVPFQAYGVRERADSRDLVIRNATVWTMTSAGKIEKGMVVVSGGKIAFAGTGDDGAKWLDANPAQHGRREIDAAGKHVTPGIIDCHSHTGLRSANEVGRAVTSMVRVEDELNPDDANWYRQLAGGVTAVNNLHGSANSIGGQNTITKLRWGVEDPLGMKMTEAPAGIKFALGENPKRGNSGSGSTFRYPQTRMGVETQIRDRFQAAKEYAAARAADPATPRDLELDALAEVLAGTRLVHCHSYRQDEILMLAHVARDFGFKIGTYQHILEGYKVAEVLREYSGGASGFSDWWAYKVEVQDAIPYAFPLMHKVGVLCSFNSDDSELARRLNTEAAKAVKYGKLGEEEALAFVTLNPAKQLKIDGQVGSLEAGKSADLAVWSGSPLSSLSRCERTIVDGIERFSIEADQAARERNAADRQRIIQRLLKDKAPRGEGSEGSSGRGGGGAAGGGNGGGGGRRRPPTVTAAAYIEMLQRGLDPHAVRAGECGCELDFSFMEEATR